MSGDSRAVTQMSLFLPDDKTACDFVSKLIILAHEPLIAVVMSHFATVFDYEIGRRGRWWGDKKRHPEAARLIASAEMSFLGCVSLLICNYRRLSNAFSYLRLQNMRRTWWKGFSVMTWGGGEHQHLAALCGGKRRQVNAGRLARSWCPFVFLCVSGCACVCVELEVAVITLLNYRGDRVLILGE